MQKIEKEKADVRKGGKQLPADAENQTEHKEEKKENRMNKKKILSVVLTFCMVVVCASAADGGKSGRDGKCDRL